MANALSVRGYPNNNTRRGVLGLDQLRRVDTRGPVPSQTTTPLRNPNDFIIPNIPLTARTGGPLPPSLDPLGDVRTGGPLPPSPNTVGDVRTGGPLPPTPLPVGGVRTGGPLPPTPNPLGDVRTGGPLPPSGGPTGTTLPALDGSRFVATATGGGPGASPASTISAMAQQFAYQPGATPVSVAQQIAAQFNTTPDQLPIEVVQQINSAFQGPSLDSASETAMGFMDDLLSREGSYITNARRRGLEQANSRGLLNSSIAAGASERAALDAAQPIFSDIMGLNSQREGQDFQALMQSRNQAFGLTSDREQQQFQRDLAGQQLAGQFESQDRDAQLAQSRDAFNAAQALSGQREQQQFAGEQNSLDRTQNVNNMLLGSEIDERNATLQNQFNRENAVLDAELRQQLQNDTVAQQDWLSDRQFTREFNGALSTMTIGSAIDLNRAIMDYAAQNPEIYTPEIISGMTNFFQMNMTGLLEQYFPDLMGGNG